MSAEEKFDVIRFDTIDSTNARLSSERLNLRDRTVYTASFQTEGKGQRGNSWKSPKDENLTFSILLKPTYLPVTKQFAISEAVTLGLTDYLLSKGIAAKIKWPNDIYVGDRKICGILIENFLGGAKLADCIIGIGLNVNQKEFDPSVPNPTSMVMETGSASLPEEELSSILKAVDKRLETLENGLLEELEKGYLERLYRIGEWHEYVDCRGNADTLTPTTVLIDGRRITGRITGVTNDGLLSIEESSGRRSDYAFKELRYII